MLGLTARWAELQQVGYTPKESRSAKLSIIFYYVRR